MHTKTKNKIAFLQQYIKNHSSRWYENYGENVTGVRIGKKTRKRKKMPYYSIVFHVEKKVSDEHLPAKNIIPACFDIKFPDGKRRMIKTDVQETGAFHFHARLLDPVTDMISGETGSLGLFLEDHRRNIYALTNFHVAAESLLLNGVYEFDAEATGRLHKVRVNGHQGVLYKGILDESIDVAFIRLPEGVVVNNTLPGGTRIGNDPVEGPIDPGYINDSLVLHIPSREGSISKIIVDNSTGVRTTFMKMDDVVAVDLCTQLGDSGSPVLNSNDQLFGIVLGGDQAYTYIIPYHKVLDFLSLKII